MIQQFPRLASQKEKFDNYFLLQMRRYFSGTHQINEAIRYALETPGKRIRPLLVLAMADMFNGSTDQALVTATAIEMIHCYSLVHDDLPAMDDDDYRRGRLATHKKYNEGMAILVGDALNLESIRYYIGQQKSLGVCETAIFAGLSNLMGAAGIEGMILGQAMDLENIQNNEKINEETLRTLYQLKTGRLILAAVEGGAMSNFDLYKNDNMKKLVQSIGEKVGFAFQLLDDIQDEVGSFDSIGKTPGKDNRDGKTTFPSLIGLESTKKMVNQLLTTVQVESQRVVKMVPGTCGRDCFQEIITLLAGNII